LRDEFQSIAKVLSLRLLPACIRIVTQSPSPPPAMPFLGGMHAPAIWALPATLILLIGLLLG
jgi:hypothetical protein